MHETWDPERLLRDCDTTERERCSSATRDLLTEPRWGKWEGAPENAPLDARDRMLPPDARDVRVPIHTARPSYAACVVVWCAAGVGVLWLLGMALRAAGAF